MKKSAKIFLLFLSFSGTLLFFLTTMIFGNMVDYKNSFLFLPFFYFLSTGLFWVSAVLLKSKVKVKYKIKEVPIEKKVIVEKPVIIEKEVFIEKEVKKEISDEYKDYYIATEKTRKFHNQGCKWANNINPENRIYFKTKKEALDRDFKVCKTCMKN